MSTSLARPFSRSCSTVLRPRPGPTWLASVSNSFSAGRLAPARSACVSPKDGSARIAGGPAAPPRALADLDDQLAHARQLERVGERQADHRERAEAHRVDDELGPLRGQDILLDLDLADRREQRLYLGEPAFGAGAQRAEPDPGLRRRRVALD